eukprot:1627518-Prymnesium_polylepis.1
MQRGRWATPRRWLACRRAARPWRRVARPCTSDARVRATGSPSPRDPPRDPPRDRLATRAEATRRRASRPHSAAARTRPRHRRATPRCG